MTSFTCHVPPSVLEQLKHRLNDTRWPDALESIGWRQGTDPEFLRRFADYWANVYDWRASEAHLNTYPQYRDAVDGVELYYIHSRSSEPGATPLLLVNGWPSSIFEYLDLIPRLNHLGFHVVAPALPGYGWSERPKQPGMNLTRIAGLFAKLMGQLGYGRFLAHGSDLGAGVLERLRRHHVDRLTGLHFSNVYWRYPNPEDPTPEEIPYLKSKEQWQWTESAYAMMHATKPQTLAYGLNDSPAGLAGWILEKFQGWSDSDVEQVYGFDALCANLALYWATETIGSSCRLYSEVFNDPETQEYPDKGSIPVGVIVCPKDILPAPRAWGERYLNLVHWTEAPRGGHFPAWEIPDLLAGDLRQFADVLKR